MALKEHNEEMRVARRPGDSWTDNSDTISEIVFDIRIQQGIESLRSEPINKSSVAENIYEEARWLINDGPVELVFDALEVAWGKFSGEQRENFNWRVNEYFYAEDCNWRLLQGELFQLDQDFLGASIIEATSDGLAAGRFAGAADEFSTALRAMQAGETKHAITEACKSYESMMKVLVGHHSASADKLTSELLKQGYLDDLPENIQNSIRQSILMSLPVLRNKLTAHGQGIDIVSVPQSYALLAIQLAGALNKWLLAKNYEKNSSVSPNNDASDEIPF